MGKDVRPDWDRERPTDIYVLRKYVYGVDRRVLQPWWVIAARLGLRLSDGPGAVAPAGGGAAHRERVLLRSKAPWL